MAGDGLKSVITTTLSCNAHIADAVKASIDRGVALGSTEIDASEEHQRQVLSTLLDLVDEEHAAIDRLLAEAHRRQGTMTALLVALAQTAAGFAGEEKDTLQALGDLLKGIDVDL